MQRPAPSHLTTKPRLGSSGRPTASTLTAWLINRRKGRTLPKPQQERKR